MDFGIDSSEIRTRALEAMAQENKSLQNVFLDFFP